MLVWRGYLAGHILLSTRAFPPRKGYFQPSSDVTMPFRCLEMLTVTGAYSPGEIPWGLVLKRVARG